MPDETWPRQTIYASHGFILWQENETIELRTLEGQRFADIAPGALNGICELLGVPVPENLCDHPNKTNIESAFGLAVWVAWGCLDCGYNKIFGRGVHTKDLVHES